MVRNLLPRQFFTLPSVWDDEDNFMAMPTSTSGLSLSEDEKNVYIKAHVPGVDPKNIDVTMHEGYLWIRGEHTENEEDKKRKYYRHAASSFSYRVAVPSDIDINAKPEATYKHGVMSVRFPKSPKTQPTKITIKEE